MLVESPIVGSRAGMFAVASPFDFALGPGREIAALPSDATPYCVDFEKQSLLCVRGDDLLSHPFLYQAQRERGRTIVEIPLEEVPQMHVEPTFIFSPGRCGSTLLVRALEAIGVPSASEPDYCRQIGRAFVLTKAPSRETCHRLLRAATAVLALRLGTAAPVIKLQAECNGWPMLIVHAFRSLKVVFIVRNPRDWALSWKRVSPPAFSARDVVRMLQRALRALDRLCEGHDVRICDYADFSQPDTAYYAELASFLGYDKVVSEPALRAALARDAQEGNRMSGSARKAQPVDPRFLDEFEKLWKMERPVEIIERRALAGLV